MALPKNDLTIEHPDLYVAHIKGYLMKYNTPMYGIGVDAGTMTPSKLDLEALNPNGMEAIPILLQHCSCCVIGKWYNFRQDEVGLIAEGVLLAEFFKQAPLFLAEIQSKARYGLSIGATGYADKSKTLVLEDVLEGSIVMYPAIRGSMINEFILMKDIRRE